MVWTSTNCFSHRWAHYFTIGFSKIDVSIVKYSKTVPTKESRKTGGLNLAWKSRIWVDHILNSNIREDSHISQPRELRYTWSSSNIRCIWGSWCNRRIIYTHLSGIWNRNQVLVLIIVAHNRPLIWRCTTVECQSRPEVRIDIARATIPENLYVKLAVLRDWKLGNGHDAWSRHYLYSWINMDII